MTGGPGNSSNKQGGFAGRHASQAGIENNNYISSGNSNLAGNVVRSKDINKATAAFEMRRKS